jgi:hypothetical protein
MTLTTLSPTVVIFSLLWQSTALSAAPRSKLTTSYRKSDRNSSDLI